MVPSVENQLSMDPPRSGRAARGSGRTPFTGALGYGAALGWSDVGQPNVELREFLRSRRARVTPAAAGLPLRPGARHVPGLRREEVAQLAGVSVDYYVRLERGRTANVSESVLDAVARALQLNDLESSHLFTLAKPSRSRSRALPPQQVPGLRLEVDSITDVPALVLGRRMDVLAANPLARALFTDFDALPPRFRNMARLVFSGRPCALGLCGLARSGPRHRRQPAPVRRPLPR